MINSLIFPKSIAVIGGSSDHYKDGGRIIINLQKSKYKGNLYAVNPKYKDVLGVPCYSSLLDIPDEIELVCIVVPAKEVPAVIKDSVKKGVKMAAIFTSGFAETGIEGVKLQEEVLKIIEGTDLRIYGPNVPGLFDFHNKWGLSFSPQFEPYRFIDGSIGVLSQGGSLGRAVIDAYQKGIGFSYWVSPGNEIDLDTNDFFEWFVYNEQTEIILMVLEKITNQIRFLEIVNEAFQRRKPIVILKLGHSALAIKAIEKHLGINRNKDISWSVHKHEGVIEVDDLDELVGVGWLLEKYKKYLGDRTLIYSWAGGSSILMTDLCVKYNIPLPPFSEELEDRFAEIYPNFHTLMNPLDLTTAIYQKPSLFKEGLELVIDSSNFDVILVPIPFKIDNQTEQMAQTIVDLAKETEIPIIPVFLSTGDISGTTYEIIAESGIPYFFKTETAIKSLSLYLHYQRVLQNYFGGKVHGESDYARRSS